MIRKPLRPLARIFLARTAGENPDLIEHANRRERIEMQHEQGELWVEGEGVEGDASKAVEGCTTCNCVDGATIREVFGSKEGRGRGD